MQIEVNIGQTIANMVPEKLLNLALLYLSGISSGDWAESQTNGDSLPCSIKPYNWSMNHMYIYIYYINYMYINIYLYAEKSQRRNRVQMTACTLTPASHKDHHKLALCICRNSAIRVPRVSFFSSSESIKKPNLVCPAARLKRRLEDSRAAKPVSKYVWF